MLMRHSSWSITLATVMLAACTPHEGEEPLPPAEHEPAVLVEVPPEPPMPAIVAPALAPLVPTRPLAHLDVLWTDTLASEPYPETLWPVGRSLLAMSEGDAATLGIDGPPLSASGLDLPGLGQIHIAGPLIILPSRVGDHFVAVERDGGAVAWEARADIGRSYLQLVSPRALVASVYGAGGDALIAWALEDGRQLWLRSGEDSGFARISRLWGEGERAYLHSDAGIEVFDPTTGKTWWRAAVAEPNCGAAAGDGVVVVEDPQGHLVLEAGDGSVRGRIGPKTQACSWENYGSAGVGSAVVSGGKLMVFDSPKQPGAAVLRAFDLADGRELWSVTGIDGELLFADQDAVFVTRNRQTLVALEADSGVVASEVSVGPWPLVRIEPVGGAAGPVVVIEDDEMGWWILGRREQLVAPEDYEIRGRLVPSPGLARKRVANLRIEVAGQSVRTNDKGRFVARGRGRGIIGVSMPEQPDVDEHSWTSVAFERQRVQLQGKGRYDLGDIEAWEQSIE